MAHPKCLGIGFSFDTLNDCNGRAIHSMCALSLGLLTTERAVTSTLSSLGWTQKARHFLSRHTGLSRHTHTRASV